MKQNLGMRLQNRPELHAGLKSTGHLGGNLASVPWKSISSDVSGKNFQASEAALWSWSWQNWRMCTDVNKRLLPLIVIMRKVIPFF